MKSSTFVGMCSSGNMKCCCHFYIENDESFSAFLDDFMWRRILVSFSLSESTCKYTELVRAKLLNPEADVRLSSVRISPTF